MAFLDSPEAYQMLGLEPPESNPHGSAADLSLARELQGHRHSWQQRGTDVYCERGEHRHGHNVPSSHILIGTGPDGAPQYKIIDIS